MRVAGLILLPLWGFDDVVDAGTLPTRVNMRQRAYFMVRTLFNIFPPRNINRFRVLISSLSSQVLRIERSFLRNVMKFWEQICMEMRQGRSKASRWNTERERLRSIIIQVRNDTQMLCGKRMKCYKIACSVVHGAD